MIVSLSLLPSIRFQSRYESRFKLVYVLGRLLQKPSYVWIAMKYLRSLFLYYSHI